MEHALAQESIENDACLSLSQFDSEVLEKIFAQVGAQGKGKRRARRVARKDKR